MSGWNVIAYLDSISKAARPVSVDSPLPATLRDASGAAVAYGFTPVEISSKTTTLVKSGAGMIGSIAINTAGSADVITVYDALTATGTPIATITAPAQGTSYCELLKFSVGLCIVTSGTTAGKYGVSFQ